MKVGDLVQYKRDIQGLEKLIGVVVGWDGDEWPVIHWNVERTRTDLTRTHRMPELPDFIEVVDNEGR